MNAEDFDAFASVVGGFAELKGKRLSEPAIELYWRAMQHWDIEDFRVAAEYLLRKCTFMPTPKDFEDLRKAGRPTAGEAWNTALSWCQAAWRSGKGCGDLRVDHVIRMLGGYETVALCPLDKLGFLERRFCEHYESFEDREEIRQALPQIAQDENLLLEYERRKRLT